eukprot:13879312-Ditylum_brightwellii.AAC.1
MNLVTPIPLLSTEEIESVSVSSSVDLFCGIIKLGYDQDDYPLLINNLVDLGNRADSLSPEDLYRVTDSIVKLQRSVEGRHRSENGNKPLSISIENACDNAASSIENGEKKSNADIQNKNDGEVEKIVTQFEKEEVAADVIINNLDPSESKKDQAEQLLSQ